MRKIGSLCLGLWLIKARASLSCKICHVIVLIEYYGLVMLISSRLVNTEIMVQFYCFLENVSSISFIELEESHRICSEREATIPGITGDSPDCFRTSQTYDSGSQYSTIV